MALLASGQITSSGTPTQLTPQTITCKKWVMKALSSNTSQVGIGPKTQIDGSALSTSNAYLMDAGDDFEIDRTIQAGAVYDASPSDVYVVGSGGVITWLAFG